MESPSLSRQSKRVRKNGVDCFDKKRALKPGALFFCVRSSDRLPKPESLRPSVEVQDTCHDLVTPGVGKFDRQSDFPLISIHARVAELADALDLGSSGAIRRGSTPLSRTTLKSMAYESSRARAHLFTPYCSWLCPFCDRRVSFKSLMCLAMKARHFCCCILKVCFNDNVIPDKNCPCLVA